SKFPYLGGWDTAPWTKCCEVCASRAFARRKSLERNYSLSYLGYLDRMARQHGCCAICHRGPFKVLQVDHCHDTLRVRGLLCGRCNKALGLFDHDPARLREAAIYLERGRT